MEARTAGGDAQLLRAALSFDVWTDPALAGLTSARVDARSGDLLQRIEAELARRVADADKPAQALPAGYGRVALHELALGTALVAQSRANGNLDVSADAVHASGTALRALADAAGAQALLEVYRLHATSLNYRALRYYGEMRREDFVRGSLHRPWCDFGLDAELRAGMARGEIETVPERPGRIRLTEAGLAATARLEEEFRASGVARARDILRQGSLRDLATGARTVVHRAVPGFGEAAEQLAPFLREIGQPRRIVEVSSLAGILADWAHDGLLGDAEAVCCGSSRGRLLQVLHETSGRVRVARCRSDGLLPFADGSVDLVVLPATPLRIWMRALLREVRRVLRAGGHLMLLSSSGWTEALPQEVRAALPEFAQDYLARQDAVVAEQAARREGYEVLFAERSAMEGEVGSGPALHELLSETGVLAEIGRGMPCDAAARCADALVDACARVMRGARGHLAFPLVRETVLAKKR